MLEENEPTLGNEYLCSYIYDDKVLLKDFASLWWFKPDQIEDLVRIENEHKIRVFPRYIYNMTWYERFDYFSWNYKLYLEYLKDIRTDDIKPQKQLREIASRNNINLNGLYTANSNIMKAEGVNMLERYVKQPLENDIRAVPIFLELLLNFDLDNFAFTDSELGHLFNRILKTINPFSGMSIPTELDEIKHNNLCIGISDAQVIKVAGEIRKYITKPIVQKWALENYRPFLDEYASLSLQSDFSYGYVWDLRLKYLWKAHSEIIVSPVKTQLYPFPFESNETVSSNMIAETQGEFSKFTEGNNQTNINGNTQSQQIEPDYKDTQSQPGKKTVKRHSAMCREKCREIAKRLWANNPTITIREMTEQDDVIENSKKINGQLFNEDTIRSWINDLCPNRSPGRPPKQNS